MASISLKWSSQPFDPRFGAPFATDRPAHAICATRSLHIDDSSKETGIRLLFVAIGWPS